MKRLFIAILILCSFSVKAQTLDTVVVTNMTFQAQDLAWLVGKYPPAQDSTTQAALRSLRSLVQTAAPQSWTATITIPSMRGDIALNLYQIAVSAHAGEIAARYTAITNVFKAKANLDYWRGRVDEAVQNNYLRSRERGKNILMDN